MFIPIKYHTLVQNINFNKLKKNQHMVHQIIFDEL